MKLNINLTQMAVLASSGFLAYFVLPVAGIKCWECNSAYDKRCGDPFQNITSELIDCDQRDSQMDHLPVQEDGTKFKANVCRKTHQTIEDETRVIRSCGWLPNPTSFKDRDCYTKTGTFHVMVFHCVCQEDGCNGGLSLKTSNLYLALLSAAAFSYAYTK